MNNPGTVLMVLSDLAHMEVECEVDENDIIDLEIDQVAEIQVDAFGDTIFSGHVVEVSNAGRTIYTGTQEEMTNFQIKVWEALLKLPEGGLYTYESIAAAIGKPQAIRAVASAIGRNPISYLIPCHRVLRKSGRISGYRWGPVRKKAIIAWEAAHIAHSL